MKWNVRNVPSGNPLTDMHDTDFATVSSLYDEQNPTQLSTYQERATSIVSQFSREHRASLVSTLSSYMKRLGAFTESLVQVERLLDPESVAVVTGQQAGLFGGPLFSIYKALSAVGLAKKLEEDLGRPVVPVFWIASEDHDWSEVNHAYVLDEFSDVRKLQIDARVEPHEMVYHTKLTTEAVESVLRRAAATIPDGAYKNELIAFLRSAWDESTSLADWFGRIMMKLMNTHGLIILDPCLEGLRHLVGSVWETAILKRETIQSELEKVYRQVQTAGYVPAVVRDETNSTVFYVENGRRYVLEIVDANTMRVRGLGIEKSAEEWAEMARQQPTSFSSNVLLRPVVQDVLLPTLAYVGGPAEVAYFPLSRGVFHGHGRTLPPVLLRQRMRLYSPAVLRNMKKWKLTIEDVSVARDLVSEFLNKQGIDSIDLDFDRRMNERRSDWDGWQKSFADLGPQVASMADAALREDKHRLQRLRRKTRRLFEQKHNAEVGQLRLIERWLWTDGHEQERRLCPLPVWAQMGNDWFSSLPLYMDYGNPAPLYEVEIE